MKNVSLHLSLAWKAFKDKNGADSFKEFSDLIYNLRKSSHMEEPDPIIGCNILISPFFFNKEEWIPAPSDWKPNIVQGKTYDTNTLIGRKIYNEVYDRIRNYSYEEQSLFLEEDQSARYGKPSLIRARLGQGSFRILERKRMKEDVLLQEKKLYQYWKPHILNLIQKMVHIL